MTDPTLITGKSDVGAIVVGDGGRLVGFTVGTFEGANDGSIVIVGMELREGELEGAELIDGESDGVSLGMKLGNTDADGANEGLSDGAVEGTSDGCRDIVG